MDIRVVIRLDARSYRILSRAIGMRCKLSWQREKRWGGLTEDGSMRRRREGENRGRKDVGGRKIGDRKEERDTKEGRSMKEGAFTDEGEERKRKCEWRRRKGGVMVMLTRRMEQRHDKNVFT